MRDGANGEAEVSQIVHKDIKPDNVFLDTSNLCHYNRYPTPKLADFGLAIETSPSDPLNPSVYNTDSGTAGYKAPEMIAFADRETGQAVDDFQLLSW